MQCDDARPGLKSVSLPENFGGVHYVSDSLGMQEEISLKWSENSELEFAYVLNNPRCSQLFQGKAVLDSRQNSDRIWLVKDSISLAQIHLSSDSQNVQLVFKHKTSGDCIGSKTTLHRRLN
ncbi:MAG: hypothetical protein EP332_08105 [Bacteroidetes bacterium]|nr:MAG: hypothetical protein EP332_08105 [Bacteroidota bacterium]